MIDEQLILAMGAILVRYGLNTVVGLHLVHGHSQLPEDTALVGNDYDEYECRWAQTTPVQDIDLDNLHGHVFVLTDGGFHPYEYHTGATPDLTGVDMDAFVQEFAIFLRENNLTACIGLQVIKPGTADMFEIVIPQGTIMIPAAYLVQRMPTRQTGWQFANENGQLRVCGKEYHAPSTKGHEPFTHGTLGREPYNIVAIWQALEEEHILLPQR